MIFNPIGLGLVGYALAYHKSWVVLAVAEVFVTFGSLSLIPVTVNYICKQTLSPKKTDFERVDAEFKFQANASPRTLQKLQLHPTVSASSSALQSLSISTNGLRTSL